MKEYLGEMEIEFENTLACLSGAQMGSNHEKKLEVENLVTHFLYNKTILKWKAQVSLAYLCLSATLGHLKLYLFAKIYFARNRLG